MPRAQAWLTRATDRVECAANAGQIFVESTRLTARRAPPRASVSAALATRRGDALHAPGDECRAAASNGHG
jgi:hypothetical protein